MKGVVEEFLMVTLHTLESDDNVFTLCWTFKTLETLSNIPRMGNGECSHHNFTNLDRGSLGYKIHLIKEALSVNKKCGRAEVDCT